MKSIAINISSRQHPLFYFYPANILPLNQHSVAEKRGWAIWVLDAGKEQNN